MPSIFDYRDERNKTRCCAMFHLVEGNMWRFMYCLYFSGLSIFVLPFRYSHTFMCRCMYCLYLSVLSLVIQFKRGGILLASLTPSSFPIFPSASLVVIFCLKGINKLDELFHVIVLFFNLILNLHESWINKH